MKNQLNQFLREDKIMQEVLFPVGRLVSGHPMEPQQVRDNNDKPLIGDNGQPVTQRYIGVAIPKGAEVHWNQTEWGAKIYAEAQDPVHGYPNGEIGQPSFSWKIVDGDSTVPNKNGNKPCEQEGYKGHWVIMMSTRIVYNCYHVGRYEPMQAIQNKAEIKRGDYCRVMCTVKGNKPSKKGNKPSKTPGVYINPQMFELSRAGIEIVTTGNTPAAASVFGGSTPVIPTNAAVDGNIAPPPPPATDLVESYSYNGVTYLKSQLLAMPGWTEDMIQQNCTRV
jgi:hypothetical protein